MKAVTTLPEWQALQALAKTDGQLHLRDLFSGNPNRFAECSRCELDILLDYSRQRVTPKVISALIELAKVRGLKDRIHAMFDGDIINVTEQRAVLHTALRASADRVIQVSGKDVTPDVQANLAHMSDFVEGVHSGRIQGTTGKHFTDVVNIGIGGSDLGIVMATEALARYRNRNITLHFASNIDGSQLADILERVNVESTLFIVCSKTFTTIETLSNAKLARQWVSDRLGDAAIAKHFAAVSTNHKALDTFNIAPEFRFTMWDWVGGRYSMWSAVGLSIAVAIGMDNFKFMLEGARDMDEHFRNAPLESNLPVLMGMLGIWNHNFLNIDSLAVLPYDQRLHRLPAYLQQLDMESNGKRVTINGEALTCDSGAVLWGEPGSNAQHSFFQLLHQGTARVTMDFIAPVNASSDYQGQQNLALANCFAQAQAFALGYSEDEIRKELKARGMDEAKIASMINHKIHPGNRPSSMILFPRLGPKTLGKVIALYEHKVYVQSVIWGINAFDQWGVELGKKLAESLAPAIENPATANVDAATKGLLSYVTKWRK